MLVARNASVIVAVAVFAAGLFGACGGEDSNSVASNAGSGGKNDSGVGGSGAITLTDAQADALTIEPASATIDVVDGVSSPLQLTAKLAKSGGTSVTVTASWSVKGPPIAQIDGSGSLSALGNLGGQVTVEAKYQSLSATAIVTIQLHAKVNPAGVSASDQQLLEGATTPDSAVQWAYPYDGTAFPQGMLSPRFMWNGGAADDTYLIKLTGPNAELEYFVKAPPPAQVVLPDSPTDLWKQVTDSGSGGKLKLFAARLSGGVATVIANHTDQLASGPLRGTVYYWANSIGRILRIKAGAAAPDDFLAAAGVGGCTACHTVSAKGARLVIGVNQADDNQSMTSFDLVNNQVKYSGGGRSWSMPAVSADGSVMVANNLGLDIGPVPQTGTFDVDTGAALPGSGLDGVALWMPAFSPDDKALAYVSPTAPNDLRMFDWDATGKKVSNERLILGVGSDPSQMIGYPTVAPDHSAIIFARSSAAAWDSRNGPSDLYITDTVPSGKEVRLAALDGDGYPFAAGDRDRHYNYEPVFAPVPAGGFFWVVFNSRRTYGNLLTGTPDTVKQLWIAAIRMDASPGEDPSYAPFWLPGQDTQTLNLRGFWALDPCKSNDTDCSDGSECCSGTCTYDSDSGTGQCRDKTGECVQDGNACEKTEDCCNASGNIACIAGICTSKGPA
jgi:hypothetical protein